jgi:hypothetical protein
LKLTFINTSKRKYSHRLPDRPPFRRRIQQLRGENRRQLFIYIHRGLTDLYGFESGYDVLLYARNDGILITKTPQDYYIC